MKKPTMNICQEVDKILQNATEEEIQILQIMLSSIQEKRENGNCYVTHLLGLTGEFINQDTYQHIIPITPVMLNPLGIVHGGITATIADSTMGALVTQILPDNQVCVTTEIKLNYIKPGTGKKLISQAVLLHRGRNLCTLECKIKNEQENLIAAASGSFYIIDKAKK